MQRNGVGTVVWSTMRVSHAIQRSRQLEYLQIKHLIKCLNVLFNVPSAKSSTMNCPILNRMAAWIESVLPVAMSGVSNVDHLQKTAGINVG